MRRRDVIGVALLATIAVALAFAMNGPPAVSPQRQVAPRPHALDADTAAALNGGVKRWVVGCDPASVGTVAAEIRGAGGRVMRSAGRGRMATAVFPDSAAAAHGVRALDALGSVAYVEPDLKTVHALYVPSDREYRWQWGLSSANGVRADRMWDVWRGSSDAVIAVVDTGVDADHADLRDRVDTANDKDFVNNDADADDDHGHGSHVAGIAAASMDDGWVVGVAPRCTILPVKVLDAGGSGYTSDVAAGIYWAVDHGADVINLSLGSSSSDPGMADACAYAMRRGVSVVAAAGNSSSSAPSYPAAYSGVIGVSAIDDSGDRAYFSNFGRHVDVCAPGVDIVSCDAHGSAVSMSGTSMASPFVAGTIAAVRSRWPGLTRAEAEQHVLENATPKHDTASNYFGAGLVNADAALRIPPGGRAGEFPGKPLSGTSATGTLDATNTADVYSVRVYAGQRIRATLTAAEGADYDLRLCPPGARSVADASWSAEGSGPYRALSVRAPFTGTYYLCVDEVDGAGEYTLTYRPSAALSQPAPAGAVRHGVSQRWSGVMKPKHTAGAHQVVLSCYRLENHAWRRRLRLTAVNSTSGSYTRYSKRFALPRSGTWKIVPTAAADAAHTSSAGPARIIRIR